MPAIISATDRPLLWAVLQSNQVIETGHTEVGNTTLTGLDMVSDADENTFLGAVAGSAGSYNPLPESGFLTTGEIYGYNGGLVIVRQSHNRTEHAPEDVPALFIVYREEQTGDLDWIAGEQVQVGTRRLYQGAVYEALQAHVTQADWFPTALGILNVLWREVETEPPAQEWQVGVAYAINDEVTYQGSTYRCLQAHTSIQTWCPTCAGILNVLWALV